MFGDILLKTQVRVALWYYSATTRTWALGKGVCSITTISENKRFSSFFCKHTNNIHEFEDCFLRGQVRSNAFKVFNGYIVESWILLVPLQKKLENLLFSEIVVTGQSSSKCPSSSSRTVKDRYSWLAFKSQQLINSKWRLFMLPMGTSLESLYFFGLHGIDLAGSNFIFLVINRTYETIGHKFCMSTRGKLYVNFVT